MPWAEIALLTGTAVIAWWAARTTGQSRTERQEARILESISDAFVALNAEWRYTYVNAKAGEMLGRDPRSLIGKHVWTEFPEGVGQPFQKAYERALAEQVPIRLEEYYPPYDRWFENSIYPSRDGLAIYFSDISVQKRLEQSLRNERDFSDAVLDSLPGVFYLYDRDFRFLRWNSNFERVTGYTATEIGRMSPIDFFGADERPLLASRIEEVFALGASSVEAKFLAKDGSLTPYYFTGLRIDLQGQTCLLGVGIDITARTRAEQALREQSERLRLALDAARMGTFDWDVPHGRIILSPRHEQLWGFSAGEFIGTFEAFARRVHPDDLPALNADVADCIARRSPFAREFRIVWPDGSVHWIIGRGEFTFDADGQPDRMRGVVVEVTDRKRTELQLRQYAASLRALTERVQTIREEEGTRIARELHDELGQSLTGLRIDVSWLSRRFDNIADPETLPRLRQKAAAMAAQIDATVQAVRRISSELRPAVLDDLGLAAAIEWQSREFQQRTGIGCRTTLLAEGLAIDPARATACYRILTEALTNVARHANAGSVVITLAQAGHDVLLDIVDDGIGISAPTPGVRSLGVLGMRERAEAFGGSVSLAPAAPRGTRVRVRIPLGDD